MKSLKEVVIVGLDGVLAFIEQRLRHLHQDDGSQDWERFYEGIIDDVPAIPLINEINSLADAGYEIVIITGRSSATRTETLEWLAMWGVNFDAIWMRPADNFVPAIQFKQAILDQHYSERLLHKAYESDYHDDVCRLLRSRNVPCILTSRNLGNGESREEIAISKIRHPCGHLSIARFQGDDSYEWLGKASLASKEPCVCCIKEQQGRDREAKAAMAKITAENMGLPSLEGTERQVVWAEGIRQTSFAAIARVNDWVASNNEKAMEEDPDYWDTTKSAIKRAIEYLEGQSSAKWWIDHAKYVRGNLDSGRSLLSAVAEEMGFN